jgi:methylthioribose-1-phosphate isomerase
MRPTVSGDGRSVTMIDQNLLPETERWITLTGWEDVAKAIEDMTVRGAPAIGVAAAYGIALAAHQTAARPVREAVELACRRFAATRPTAHNLFVAIERMRAVSARLGDASPDEIREALLREARAIEAEDVEVNRAIGRYGAGLLPDEATVITHCNAGALACAGYGTALGVIRAAREAGKTVTVFADETRPRLQGMRLTAWELLEDGFDVTVMPDGAAGLLMSRRRVDAVIVGADCIAANGDVANKVGTFHLALAARRNDVPFYVAAPTSTVNPGMASGSEIPIEERDAREVTEWQGVRLAPAGVKVYNPAFDVTPADLVTAIITERGVHRAPYDFSVP